VKNVPNTVADKIEIDKEVAKDIPTIKVEDNLLKDSGVTLFIRREDLNHPQLSGNKWHKLKYNLVEAQKGGHDTLLTFGGAYSNHIYALAAAGKIFNFSTIGIIRGEEHLPLNPTLSFAKKCGMKLHYMDKSTYRKKNEEFVNIILAEKFGRFYLIPEGGTNELVVKGCSEIVELIDVDFDYICCACGTGGTLAGLIAGLNEDKRALGFAILKRAGFLNEKVSELLRSNSKKTFNNWQINLEYHFNGYAKFNLELIEFIEQFERKTNIPIEPIYTGKMLYGIYDLVRKGFFPREAKIMAVHTGGLQGLRGLADTINNIKNRSQKNI
jgi:1-aminocyclopropane-1-carboxylate deaminase